MLEKSRRYGVAPVQIRLFLSQKPSTENDQFCVSGLRLAWVTGVFEWMAAVTQATRSCEQSEQKNRHDLGIRRLHHGWGLDLANELSSRFCGKDSVSVGTSRSRPPAKVQYEPRVDILQHGYGVCAVKYGMLLARLEPTETPLSAQNLEPS